MTDGDVGQVGKTSVCDSTDGREGLRIFSWNVNGVRAVLRKGALQQFIEQYQPDVLCLQEVKARQEQVDDDFPGYRVFWNAAERPGYSGTATLIREGLADEARQIVPEDLPVTATEEGRVLVIELPDFYLINVYVPNAKPDLSRLTLRHDAWDPGLLRLIQELERSKPVVICGDFNAAFSEIDLARPKANRHNAGFTDEERAGVGRMLEAGFIDTFRALHPGVQRYTWWSHWGQSRANNVGWRIDYFFISGCLRGQLRDAEIYEGVTGSDHCPVSVTLEMGCEISVCDAAITEVGHEISAYDFSEAEAK